MDPDASTQNRIVILNRIDYTIDEINRYERRVKG